MQGDIFLVRAEPRARARPHAGEGTPGTRLIHDGDTKSLARPMTRYLARRADGTGKALTADTPEELDARPVALAWLS